MTTFVTVAICAAAVGGWFLLYALVLLATRPVRPEAAPAAQELPGSEPPAVVSLLAGNWELTEDAAESTFIDLAARKYLEFRQPANDPMQTTIHVRQTDASGLTEYESSILNRVKGLAVDGVVPLTALTFRDQNQATRFGKRLEQSIIADARQRGLSRRRFSPAVVSALSAAGAIPALAVGGAIGINLARHHKFDDDWLGV